MFVACVNDIPTQLPTQGQWWSNLAMQRLHTAQCLDLIGFRICRRKFAFILYLTILSTHDLCSVSRMHYFTKQVLQNMLRSRLPVSASSTIVCREEIRKTDRISKNEKSRQKHGREINVQQKILSCQGPFGSATIDLLTVLK